MHEQKTFTGFLHVSWVPELPDFFIVGFWQFLMLHKAKQFKKFIRLEENVWPVDWAAHQAQGELRLQFPMQFTITVWNILNRKRLKKKKKILKLETSMGLRCREQERRSWADVPCTRCPTEIKEQGPLGTVCKQELPASLQGSLFSVAAVGCAWTQLYYQVWPC